MKRDRLEVTKENFGDLLVESMREAVAYERGEVEARVDRRKITARKATTEPAPLFDAARIKKIRDGFGVSQPVFAGMVGVATVTVKGWEQGAKNPGGSSRRVLQMMEISPKTAVAAAKVDGIEVIGLGAGKGGPVERVGHPQPEEGHPSGRIRAK